jgi:hypothetical protein
MLAAVQELVEPETAGDPMTGQKWVRSSLRSVADRLAVRGGIIWLWCEFNSRQSRLFGHRMAR